MKSEEHFGSNKMNFGKENIILIFFQTNKTKINDDGRISEHLKCGQRQNIWCMAYKKKL